MWLRMRAEHNKKFALTIVHRVCPSFFENDSRGFVY
jgi:hypothetical protein